MSDFKRNKITFSIALHIILLDRSCSIQHVTFIKICAQGVSPAPSDVSQKPEVCFSNSEKTFYLIREKEQT